MSCPEQDTPGGFQAASGQGSGIPVPSGQPVTLQDVIWNVPGPEGLALRFRFVAPQIAREGGSVSYELAAQDIQHLCKTYVIPRLATFGPVPTQIIISLSDRVLAFGQAAPEATQYFESFRLQDNHCIWEVY